MRPFPLLAEKAEHLDQAFPRAAEPVRHPGVELGRLPRAELDVLIAEHEPEPAVQDVEPLVALVGLRLGVWRRTGMISL